MSQKLRVVRDQREQAIAYLADHPDCGRLELANAIGWGEGTARKFLAENRPRKRGRPRKTAKEVMPNHSVSVSTLQSGDRKSPGHDAQPQLASAPAGALPLGVSRVTSPEPAPAAILAPPRAIAPRLGAGCIAIGAGLSCLAVYINAQVGWRYGGTDLQAQWTFFVWSALIDSTAQILPPCAGAAWSGRRRVASAFMWLIASGAITLATMNTLTYAELHVTDAVAERQTAIVAYKTGSDRRQNRIEAAQMAVRAAADSRFAECQRRGPICREREAQEQTRISELNAAIDAPIPATPAIGDIDPQGSVTLRLLKWAGLPWTGMDMGNLWLSLMAVIANLGGVALAFGCALRGRARHN